MRTRPGELLSGKPISVGRIEFPHPWYAGWLAVLEVLGYRCHRECPVVTFGELPHQAVLSVDEDFWFSAIDNPPISPHLLVLAKEYAKETLRPYAIAQGPLFVPHTGPCLLSAPVLWLNDDCSQWTRYFCDRHGRVRIGQPETPHDLVTPKIRSAFRYGMAEVDRYTVTEKPKRKQRFYFRKS